MTGGLFKDVFKLGGGALASGVVVKFGTVNAGPTLTSGTYTNAINDYPRATLKLDANHPTIPLLDWRAGVHVARIIGDETRPMFTGDTIIAEREGDQILVEAHGISAFTELQGISGYYMRCKATEMILAIVLDSGMPEMKIDLREEPPPAEIIEVVCPVESISIERGFTAGGVYFVPRSEVVSRLYPRESPPIIDDFFRASAYAVTYVTGTYLIHGETEGVSRIDAALAWIITRSRYSSAVLPNGLTPSWRRDVTQSRPKRSNLVSVRGMLTQRFWFRDRSAVLKRHPLPADNQNLALNYPALTSDVPDQFKQALLACERATSEIDIVSAVSAVWEALEFYATDAVVPKMFTRAEMRRIRKAIPDDFDGLKKQRLDTFLGQLNTPPLMVKLRHRLASDGVPMSESELDHLGSIRRFRNSSLHGQSAVLPKREDVDRAVSLVARVLVHWAHSIISGRDRT